MAMMEDQTEQILWGLLENERYIGATVSKSPHRKLMRPRCGSPDEYTTEKTEPLPAPNIPLQCPLRACELVGCGCCCPGGGPQ